MSHVREGELHAYLDGALDRLGSEVADQVRLHLAACEDCQSRVEEERKLREEASTLLDLASSREIVAPPFEELLRRAAVGGDAADESGLATPPGAPPSGKSAFPAYKWAWAASLVLALGTGWAIGGGSLNFRDFPPAALQQAAEPREEFEEVASTADVAAPSAEIDAVETESGARSAGALRQEDRGVDADATQSRARLATPPSAAPPATPRDPTLRDAQERAKESDEERPNAQVEAADAPKREDAPQPVMDQAGANAEARLEEAVDSFEDAGIEQASDGLPLFLENRPVLGVVEDANGGPSGVLQQLANGDSVMFVWSGDALAENEVGRLEASLDSVSPVMSAPDPRLLARRTQPTEVRARVAPISGFGLVSAWPTVVRLRRGAALLTVYGSGDESELRSALAAAGLIPPGT